MRKSLMAFLFCLTSTIANAQSERDFKPFNKTVLCGLFEDLIDGLSDKDISELPVWVGNDESGKNQWGLFVNKTAGTFTIVQFTDRVACIIGTGTKSRELLPPK